MDEILVILVNLSPILLVVCFIIFLATYDSTSKKYIILCNIVVLFSGGLVGVFPALVIWGYGNIIVACTTQFILMIWIDNIFFQHAKRKKKRLDYFGAIFSILYRFEASICLYLRLRYEDILRIKFIDFVLYELTSINYVKFFCSFLENEWVKGISIGALGTVIGGLMLDKIKKSK